MILLHLTGRLLTPVPARGIFTALGVLILILFASPSANAQPSPEAESAAFRGREVWSASLTVGPNGRMLGFGEFGGRETGSISQAAFTWRGVQHRVTNLYYNPAPRGADSWSLVIDISPALKLEADEFACLTLRLGDFWFNLADGQGNGRQFFWYDVDLPWNNGDVIEVGLREFPPGFEARSITGWGNNLLRPELGMAETHLLRKAAVGFDFAMSGSMVEALPDARTISNLLHRQVGLTPNAAQATDMLWQWGQFLDHDISLTPSTITSSGTSIPIPRGDPTFDPFGTGLRAITFNRSLFDPLTGTGLDNPREQMNLITAFIDASNVYGSSTERAQALRTNDGSGRLKTMANGRFLPLNPTGFEIDDGGRPRSGLFLAGDIRVNEQVVLTAMHTLFVREHNRLAEQIAAEHPELTGQEIYELARKIVGAQMQVITFQEFLPLLIGADAIPSYRGYDSEIDPSIANEFSTAAFRVGHTMLSPSLMMIDSEGEVEEASLAQLFFDPPRLREQGIDVFLRGIVAQQAQEVDLELVDEIRNMLFGPPGSPGRDLAALNIQRGRDHGLPRYNIVRRAYGLPSLRDFSEISSVPAIQAALEAAYEDVDEVDLWTAGLAEDHAPGAMVGETFRAIIADQFRRLRDGDRFWFENDPCFLSDPELLAEVRSTTLADIIRRNTDIGDELPDNVFGGGLPAVRLVSDIEPVNEGDVGVFTLIRSGPTTRPLSVAVEISESGAMLDPGTATGVPATFGVGQHEARVSVSTSDDASAEFDSRIRLAVGESAEYEIDAGFGIAEFLVLDNDSLEIALDAGLTSVDWAGQDGVDIGVALDGVGDQRERIVAVYRWDDQSERWLVHFTALEPFPNVSHINSLRTLRTGHIYLVRTTQGVTWRIPKPVVSNGAAGG